MSQVGSVSTENDLVFGLPQVPPQQAATDQSYDLPGVTPYEYDIAGAGITVQRSDEEAAGHIKPVFPSFLSSALKS
jgi:hypothetical protein